MQLTTMTAATFIVCFPGCNSLSGGGTSQFNPCNCCICSVNEACNSIIMLTLPTPGSLTARQTHKVPTDMDDLFV